MENVYSITIPQNIVFRNLIWIIDFSSEVFSLCKSLDENTLEMKWEEDFSSKPKARTWTG